MSDRERIKSTLAQHSCDLVYILDRFILSEKIIQHAKAFMKSGALVDKSKLHESLLQLDDSDYTEWHRKD